MFNYKIYGITIGSDIKIEELIAVKEDCIVDATISFGLVSNVMEAPAYEDESIKYSTNEFYLHIKQVAYFYVSDGNKILVQLEGENKLPQAKVFLLGSCLGILLAQRKTIAIHGGAVVIGRGSIIITGNSGAGKSTLTSAFRKEGHSFLADDVVALGKEADGTIISFSAFPQQKLCEDAIEKMGFKIDGLILIDGNRKKYAMPSNKSFFSDSVHLKAIYEINIVDEEMVNIEEVYGVNKLILILKNIYRMETIRLDKIDPIYFKKCLEIAKNTKVYKINRPRNAFSVDEQVKLIKASLC